MKIIVTGGAGFIASHLVDRLIHLGHRVVVVDDLSTGKRKNLNPRAKFYRLDIGSAKLAAVFKKERPQVVFHLAAQMSVRQSVADPLFDSRVNILGSINLLEQCKKYKVKKIIFSSTGGALYGEAPRQFLPTRESYPAQPLSPYGIAKLSVEYYLNYYYEIFGLRFVALRFSNVYGPRQNAHGEAGVVAIFCDAVLHQRRAVINGTGQQTRDYVFVGDVVNAAILAMRKNVVGSFNIGTGKETSVNDIFKKIVKAAGVQISPKYGAAKEGEQRRSALHCGRARQQLGWQPQVSLEQGIGKTVRWFAEQ
ncbi:GDP-mannose 4,6-dehydratase [Candidatus Falkowbacteria bacterium]|nr:GDP-mannose 4,6-dehydratase [Candidatus Falkowbacteria bacterium]